MNNSAGSFGGTGTAYSCVFYTVNAAGFEWLNNGDFLMRLTGSALTLDSLPVSGVTTLACSGHVSLSADAAYKGKSLGSVADAGTVAITTYDPPGGFVYFTSDRGDAVRYVIQGSGNATIMEYQNTISSKTWTATKDNAGTINVYWNSGTLTLQNNSGQTTVFYSMIINPG